MDGADLEVIAQTGELLFLTKLFMTAVHCLWMYDYLLTLEDEIDYAWSGRKSWVFLLFIANRYTPVVHLVWINITMFNYTKSLCGSTPLDLTKWMAMFHTVFITVFAQMAIALRIYAVSGKNKLLGGVFLAMISAQFCFGVYFIIRMAISPALSLPEINLDVFEICLFAKWHLGELLITNLSIAFDFLAFLTILVTAKRHGATLHSTIPTIMDVILRDATLYFLFIFVFQLLLELFLLVAPEEIQLIPGIADSILIPMMASRLMLSLKKAATMPELPWSLETMNNSGRRISFAPRKLPGGLQEISEIYILPVGGDIELESLSRSPKDR